MGHGFQLTENQALNWGAEYRYVIDYRTFEQTTSSLSPDPFPHLLIPLVASDLGEADVYGAELFVELKARSNLKLSGSYSYIDIHFYTDETSNDIAASNTETDTPNHQFYLRSQLDLPRNLEHSMMLRWVDSVEAFSIPSYWELDARLGWKPCDNWEFPLVGRNLLNSAHPEYQSEFITIEPADIERRFLVTAT